MPEGSESPSAQGASRSQEGSNRATPAEISEMMAKNLRMRTKRVPRVIRRNYFLYLLFYEGFFRWAVVGALLCVVIVIAVVPRIWITSPSGYTPIRKVRGLDIIQGAAFRRAAVREESAGRIPESIQKWRAALASDPANIEAVRGFIGALARQKSPDSELMPQGMYEADELFRLTGTNDVSITAVSEFYLRYNQYGWLLEKLDTPTAPKNLTATRALLAALLFNDRLDRMGEVLRERAALIQNDTEATLFRQAWLAEKGSSTEAKAARGELETAAADPTRRVSALRLLLFLNQKDLRLDEFERHLAILESVKEARFQDRFVHLLLLKTLGRSKDAAEIARTSLGIPDAPTEAIQLIDIWSEFQMYAKAAEFARENIDRFRYSPGVWVRLGQVLVAGKSWEELRTLGIKLRGVELIRPILGNYGWFLEGVGLRGLRNDEAADDAFGRFVAQPTIAEEVNFDCALTLSRLGYPNRGLPLLKSMVNSTNAGTAFWKQYLLTSYEARNANELLIAAKRIYDADRTNSEAQNDYAAALLTLRKDSSDALQITLNLSLRNPGSINLQINHAQALVQNRRLAECESLLKGIPLASLTAAQKAQMDLAWFELRQQQGRAAEARAAADRIDRRFLFTDQVDWLTKTIAALPKG